MSGLPAAKATADSQAVTVEEQHTTIERLTGENAQMAAALAKSGDGGGGGTGSGGAPKDDDDGSITCSPIKCSPIKCLPGAPKTLS